MTRWRTRFGVRSVGMARQLRQTCHSGPPIYRLTAKPVDFWTVRPGGLVGLRVSDVSLFGHRSVSSLGSVLKMWALKWVRVRLRQKEDVGNYARACLRWGLGAFRLDSCCGSTVESGLGRWGRLDGGVKSERSWLTKKQSDPRPRVDPGFSRRLLLELECNRLAAGEL
jgi:hypothetical protein